MLDPESQSLKDMLLASGIIPADQLAEVEEEYERSAKPLKELLINYDMIMEDQLLEMIATNLGTEVVDLTHVEIEKSVIDMVPGDTARMLGVVPLSYDGTSLTVTVRNPLNYQIGDELRFMLNKDIITVVSPEAQIDRFLEKYYPMDMGSMQDMLAEMELQDGLANLNENDLENAASEAPIIKFVDAVLYQAVKDKASDIHFEPFEKEFKIRYRIDGALYEMAPATKNLAIPVISRVKIMS
ncbi:MAG: pilus assembly protein PilB, partial [Lentisphaeria bacterium]|nr:pilus assembly protein PilB [Lentisphaeria bacterium]